MACRGCHQSHFEEILVPITRASTLALNRAAIKCERIVRKYCAMHVGGRWIQQKAIFFA